MPVFNDVPIASKAIYGLLQSSSNITNVFGNRVFPVIAEEGTAVPFIVYIEREAEPIVTKDGTFARDHILLEVNIVAKTYNASREAAQPVLSLLGQTNSATYNSVTISKIIFQNRLLPVFDENANLWIEKHYYKVWVEKS